MKISSFFFLFFLFAVPVFAGVPEQEDFEIPGADAQKIEDAKEAQPIEEVREGKSLLDREVPKPLTRTAAADLTPAERERLAELERKRATGELTPVEYDVEKDVLARESNIKF